MELTTSKDARVMETIAAAQPASDLRAESFQPASVHLPDSPLVTIEARKSWVALDLKEVWAYRELLFFLTWRDVKVRYKQTLLGAAWAILQPLFTMLIFSLFFGKLAGIKSDNIPYPLFAFAGLLPWTFFSNAVTNSGNSLVASAHLITKVYFPRIIVPAAAVCAGLVDLLLGFAVLGGLMIYYGVGLSTGMLLLPALMLLVTLFALGVGMLLSALNVQYRDVRHALPFVIQLWMFASPIIYPVSYLPERWRPLLALNPLTGIIESFRAAIFGQQIKWAALAVSLALTCILLVCSAYAFRRIEKRFADII